jgi:hypothetical protein
MLKDVMFKTFKCINTYKLSVRARGKIKKGAQYARERLERERDESLRRCRDDCASRCFYLFLSPLYTLFNCSNMHLSMFCIYYLHVCERVRPNGSPFIIDTPFQVGWEHALKHRPVSLSLSRPLKQRRQLSFSALSH